MKLTPEAEALLIHGLGKMTVDSICAVIQATNKRAQNAELSFVTSQNLVISALATVVGGHIASSYYALLSPLTAPEETMASFMESVREEFAETSRSLAADPALVAARASVHEKVRGAERAAPEPTIEPGPPNPNSPWRP